jgi:hypothetical protein
MSQRFRNKELPQQRKTSPSVAFSDGGYKYGRQSNMKMDIKDAVCDVRMYIHVTASHGHSNEFPASIRGTQCLAELREY